MNDSNNLAICFCVALICVFATVCIITVMRFKTDADMAAAGLVQKVSESRVIWVRP